MKIEIQHILKSVAFLFFLFPAWTWAASYIVSTSTSIIDGDTFCGGSACTSADTIIIAGGERGSIRFRDFDGVDDYITIKNEPTNRVIITSTRDANYQLGVLNFENCKYVNLRGDNNTSHSWIAGTTNFNAYGIKVILNDIANPTAGGVWVSKESDHIKISYIEVDQTDGTGSASSGIVVKDGSITAAWTYDTFEIHHNYIHDTRYAGMYLGHGNNNEGEYDNPRLANFSVHDNLLENLGSYGTTYKGIADGSRDYFYNNIVRVTGANPGVTPGGVYRHGLGFNDSYGDSYAKIYNNWIEKTVGPGLKIGPARHLVYNNLVLGCGTIDESVWASGILLYAYANGVHIYDNIIIQPTGYGILATSNTSNITDSRNLVGDAGDGERYSEGGMTEGIGADANVYYAAVSSFAFNTWSDDNDYSNDDFSLTKYKSKPLISLTPVTGFSIIN